MTAIIITTAVAGYLGWLYTRPYGPHRRCGGTGRNWGSTSSQWGKCKSRRCTNGTVFRRSSQLLHTLVRSASARRRGK